MIEEDSYPIGMHIALTLAGLVLVNIAVTAFGSFTAKPPAPEPTFERVSGASMLNISRTELEDILSKSQGPGVHDTNTGTGSTLSSSSVDESMERHAETVRKDDMLGNAEEMLQRASHLSGKTPGALDKPKPGKARPTYPSVIEVATPSPSSTLSRGAIADGVGEVGSGTVVEEEAEIAGAVSAFEAAVNRSREAHRRALAAEKEMQTRSRLQSTNGSTAPVIPPQPVTTRIPQVLPKAKPVAKPKPKSSNTAPTAPKEGSQVKVNAIPKPKPKTANVDSNQAPPTVGKKPEGGKGKKPKSLSKTKAHKNALLLATMSDEALAAMAMEKDRQPTQVDEEDDASAELSTTQGDSTLGSNSTREQATDASLISDDAIRESQRRLQVAQTGWRCSCEGGFLPPGMFGGAESVLRMGMGECYHNKNTA